MKRFRDTEPSGASRRWPAILLLFVLAPLAAGCLQVETTVRVERDGSGTITERFMMGKEAVEMVAVMLPKGETFTLMDEEQLKADAADYGDRVRFESAEAVQDDFGQGYVVRYAFDDVGTLRLKVDPGDKVPGGEPVEPKPEPDTITFAFEASSPRTLTVRWPVDRGAGGEPAEAAPEGEPLEPSAEDLEMAKAFMKDMRMTMHVEAAGDIVETNATHREGSRITLIDFSFDDLLANPEALKALMMAEPETLAEAKDLIAGVPGLALETEPEVMIRFQ